MSGENPPSIQEGGETTAAEDFVGEAAATPQVGVGALLRLAREEKFVSINDVSRALKITHRQVEAIEADDWTGLSCSTIIRGFVRNYAKLLGKDPEVFMQALNRMQMPIAPELQVVTGPTVKLQSMGHGGRRDFVRVATGLSLLCIAIAAYFFAPADFLKSPRALLGSAVQSPATLDDGNANSNSDISSAPKPATVPTEPRGTVEGSRNGSVLPALGVTDVPVSGGLQFVFAEPAWVEVKDGKGAIIFSQLSVGGSQQNVSGQPPFSLVIGNAAHVTLQYKGKPVDLSKRSKDDVARLTLE